ncbi:MAG: hypothetical protein KatS3mg057_1024 [Herpetosiphonaceae bacterium]|nr:MAG: hypothetical protein KatS3mg057_1024 [Herpetosiphonaceae bacterium]
MYYLRLLWLFIRSSIQQEMAFRVNFSIKLLNAILRLVDRAWWG